MQQKNNFNTGHETGMPVVVEFIILCAMCAAAAVIMAAALYLVIE